MTDIMDALAYASDHGHMQEEETPTFTTSFDTRVTSIPKHQQNRTCNIVGRPLTGLPAGNLEEFSEIVGILRSKKPGTVGGKTTTVAQAAEMVKQRAPGWFVTRYVYFIKYGEERFVFTSRSSLGEDCPARKIYNDAWAAAKKEIPVPGGERQLWRMSGDQRRAITKRRGNFIDKVWAGGIVGDLEIKPGTQHIIPFLFMSNENDNEEYPLVGKTKFLILNKTLKKLFDQAAKLDWASRRKAEKGEVDPYAEPAKEPWHANDKGWIVRISSTLKGGDPEYTLSFLRQCSVKDCVADLQRNNPDLAPESVTAVLKDQNVNLNDYFINPNPDAFVTVDGEFTEGGIHEATRIKSAEEIQEGLTRMIKLWEADKGVSSGLLGDGPIRMTPAPKAPTGQGQQPATNTPSGSAPTAADLLRKKKEEARLKAEKEAEEARLAAEAEVNLAEGDDELDDVLSGGVVESTPEPDPEPEAAPQIADQSDAGGDDWDDEDIPF